MTLLLSRTDEEVDIRVAEALVCDKQEHLNCVLMRLIDDLLALDSIVHFDLSEWRLEQTATFSIPAISDGGGGGGSVDVILVVAIKLEGTSVDVVRALKKFVLCKESTEI
ncbi:hypothetical protein Tco_0079079 [Tanacetum coccineum]